MTLGKNPTVEQQLIFSLIQTSHQLILKHIWNHDELIGILPQIDKNFCHSNFKARFKGLGLRVQS